MSQLMVAFSALAAQAAFDAKKMEPDAATAAAFFMTEVEANAAVEVALGALNATPPDPKPLGTWTVRAAMAALPEQVCDDYLTQIRQRTASDRKLERAIQFRSLSTAIRHIRAEIAIARSNQSTGPKRLILDPYAPRDCARSFLERISVDGHPTVRRWKERWYQWTGTFYIETTAEAMHGLIYTFLEGAFIQFKKGKLFPLNPDDQLVKKVLHAMAPMVLVDGQNPRVWLDGAAATQPDPSDLIIFSNVVISVSKWLEGSAEALIPHSPSLFTIAALPFQYDPAATCPTFEAFVAAVFEGDVDRINALRVYGGYLLTPDTSLQFIMILIGVSRSGKGTLIRILIALLGTMHVATPKLATLKSDFGLQPLIGKTFAAFTDCHFIGGDAVKAVEFLLAISGEDSVDINLKYRDFITSIRLATRLALVMNEAVALPDTTGALLNRMIFLPFKTTFMGKEDTTLTQRICEGEMPGVANWFLEGLRILRHARAHARSTGISDGQVARKLMQAPIGEEYIERFRRMASPIAAYVSERCELGTEFMEETDEIYANFIGWSEICGHQKRSKTRFVEDLTACVAAVQEVRPRTGTEQRPRMLAGIRIRRSEEDRKYRESLKQLKP